MIKIEKDQFRTEHLAVGALSDEDGVGIYCFILDNHSWSLVDCNRQHYKMTRVGTVFYQLDVADFIGVNQRTMQFNGWRDTEEEKPIIFSLIVSIPRSSEQLIVSVS